MPLQSFCQDTIPNGNMEKWTLLGFNKVPENWMSLDLIYFFLGAKGLTTSQSNDAHSGSYALKLNSVSITDSTGTQNLPGLIYNQFAYTKRPATFNGYLKASSGNTDTVFILVSFSKVNGSKTDSIGGGFFAFNTMPTTYTQFSVPLSYLNSSAPDSCKLGFAYTGDASKKGYVLLDDLTLEGGNIGIMEKTNITSLNVYPNPSINEVNVSFNTTTACVASISITDANGRVVNNISSGFINQGCHSFTLDISSLTNGIYTIHTNTGAGIRTQQFIINR